jgi:hypothetical protein
MRCDYCASTDGDSIDDYHSNVMRATLEYTS